MMNSVMRCNVNHDNVCHCLVVFSVAVAHPNVLSITSKVDNIFYIAVVESHFNKNRLNRRTVREDIPVAKEAYTEETAKAQYERMKQLEEHRKMCVQGFF